jgi:iron(III) transport system ATP-binding protein
VYSLTMTANELSSKVDHGRSWGPHGTAAATIAGRLSMDMVSLAFGTVEAVREVSFELAPGEIACLLGPSGCGKTTLLRIAAGVERPQSGRVAIDGIEVAGPKRFVPPERRNVGLVFQDFALFPHLSILDNVAFGLKKLPRRAALREARAALERVGLGDFASSYPHVLSGGEQQRVALARAIVPRPQVMLMDEPFSGLDQRLRDTVREETLALLKETRATALLVTHDPIEAMEFGDRILLMRQGRLVQSGSPADLYNGPADAEAARFFSDVNELRSVARGGSVATPLGTFAAPGLASGERALVLIRPQGFALAEGDIGLEAYILDTRFLGDEVQLSVLFKGVEEPLTVRLDASRAPKQGDTAFLVVDPAHVMVFPAA